MTTSALIKFHKALFRINQLKISEKISSFPHSSLAFLVHLFIDTQTKLSLSSSSLTHHTTQLVLIFRFHFFHASVFVEITSRCERVQDIKMGFKVNSFVLVLAAYAIPYKNYSCQLLVFTSTVFILIHQYWKTWKFIEKFPGGRTLPIARRFLENSSSGFYAELKQQWRKYGCDKFVMWIGFERFVTVSKWCDVKVNLLCAQLMMKEKS